MLPKRPQQSQKLLFHLCFGLYLDLVSTMCPSHIPVSNERAYDNSTAKIKSPSLYSG